MGGCLTTDPVVPSYQLAGAIQNDTFGGQRAFYDRESDIIINGYLKFSGEKKNKCYDRFLPKDLMFIISTYLLTTLTIKKSTVCTLESGREYLFDSLTLEPWAILTVNGYDSNKKEGGILFIKCRNSLILQEGSSINMNGRGYHSGEEHENIYNTLKGHNERLLQSQYKLKCGDGYDGANNNKKDVSYNGNGGGCIYIECDHFHCHDGNILACGHKGYSNKTQYNNGYGGNIHIVIKKTVEIDENSKILAIGLAQRHEETYFGTINISCNEGDYDKFEGKRIRFPGQSGDHYKNISPNPTLSTV